ncbi:MAG: NAD(P)/FAD-dependent oxidoreductase [Lachnospiraceae bacterium]|nr:NAD(P)/FAD-dependent oxidoreductase [Lachnospiraceae bacterium]
MYDAAIIGTGPAGLSAALNLKIHGKKIIWLGSKEICEKVEKAEQIMNYPGFPGSTGSELTEAFRRQAREMELEATDLMVNSIVSMGDYYALMAGSEFVEAKTILLTTGITRVGTLERETELLGRGVSYCATCDGLLYRGRTIGVISTSPRFEAEVEYLAGLAEKVYLFARYKNCGVDLPNVEIVREIPRAIKGENRVEAVGCADGTKYAVDGVFCLRTAIRLNTLLPGLETVDGHIAVDRKMETNMSGCFAAGDCTGRPYQYAKAIGEGNVAAHSILDYLAEKG